MKITFITPQYPLSDIEFGAASFGMVGHEDERVPSIHEFQKDLNGIIITGSYEQCLTQLPTTVPQAMVVLFGNAGGENEFLEKLYQRMPCPMTGGGAAIDGLTGKKGLITGAGDAALFLITDSRYDVEVVSRNIHTKILDECVLELNNPREICSINGNEPIKWLAEKRAALGLAEQDFEHLTLSDSYGINAHLSILDGKLVSGRDLHPRMVLRFAEPSSVYEQMRAFYDDADSITFGCAGLKGLLDKPLYSAGTGLFMFGEVCTINGKTDFGNLMLSKLSVRDKRK